MQTALFGGALPPVGFAGIGFTWPVAGGESMRNDLSLGVSDTCGQWSFMSRPDETSIGDDVVDRPLLHCAATRLSCAPSGGDTTQPPPASSGNGDGIGDGSGGGPGKPKRSAITMNPRYHDGLVAFKNRCTDYPVIKACVSHLLSADDPHKIRQRLSVNHAPAVADVGCGDGTITAHLVSTVTGIVPSGTYHVVEPMADYIAQTQGRVPQTNWQFRYFQQPAESFFSEAPAAYDLIFASHSLHLIQLEALQRIANRLTPGGALVVVIGAKVSIMSILKDLFVPTPAITGDDIAAALQELDQEYEMVVEPWPSELDLGDLALPELLADLTEEAKNILSLMIQKNIDDIAQADYARVRSLISERMAEDKKLRLDNDVIIFKRK